MTQQDDRRRSPLYWFQHNRVGYMPLPFFPLSGVHPFCFFRSREYAREFLYHWVPAEGLEKPWTSQSISRNDWSIDGDDNADRLLAVCNEAAQEGYRSFLVDPPLTTLQGLDAALTRSLVDVKSGIEDGAAWAKDGLAAATRPEETSPDPH
jgi:hypothetical protein